MHMLDVTTPAGIILYKLKFDKNDPRAGMLYWGETSSPDLVNLVTNDEKFTHPNSDYHLAHCHTFPPDAGSSNSGSSKG